MATPYDSGNPYDAPLTFDGDPAASTPSSLPRYTMQATSLAGVTGDVPAAVLSNIAFEFSAKSAITFTIPEGTSGYDLVDDYSLMKLYRDGVLVDDGQWTVRGVKKSMSDLKKVKEVTAFHRLWDALERTAVSTKPPTAPKRYFYSVKTPGFILNDLLTDAKTRQVRTIKDLTWTFTAAVDSAGRAWPQVFSIEYRHGTPYNQIFANLVDRGIIEVRLRGNEIQLYVADKMGIVSNADLKVGQDLIDAPVQSDSSTTGGVLIVTGDDDVTVVAEDATTIATYGREEFAESQGGTSDVGSLNYVAQTLIGNYTRKKEQRTYTVVMRGGALSLPIRDYNVSDFVHVTEMVEGMTIRRDQYRVRQLVLNFEGGQVYTAAIVLNDKFQEADVRLARKVEGIIGGAVITGSARTSTPDDLKDKGIPNPPTSLSGQSGAYVDSNGVTKAQATLTWTPPTQNTDGTAITDLDRYQVAWRYSDDPPIYQWSYATEPPFFLSPLDPGRDLIWHVRAIDTSGNWSAVQPGTLLPLGTDTTAPPTPSAPAMTSYLGTVGGAWDGLGSAGEQMPTDFKHVEVATSKVAAFDFDAGTLQGTLSASGDLLITGYSIGDTVYMRFRAVDLSGNKSAASAASSVQVHGVSGPDLEANSITTNHLVTGAVDARVIKAGAVTTDKLTIGQTANLVPDPGFNDAGWRARRKTTEFTEKPLWWFFKENSSVKRSGWLLQLLSGLPASENQGKMILTDWIDVQMGEKYYVGCMNRTGEFSPNAEARLHIGIEIENVDGSLVTDYLEVNPTAAWFRDSYVMSVQQDWKRIRYWIRPYRLTSGDLAVDDFEVRCTVGTTALTGGRIQLDGHGLKMWDDADNQTVNMDALFGTVTVRGTIMSGFTGKRIEMNPGSTLLPEIRFYPTTGSSFAYINSSDNGSIPFIGMNAPDDPVTDISSAVVLYDQFSMIGAIHKASGALQAGIGIYGMTKATGEVILYGKLGWNAESHRMFSGARWAVGVPTTGAASLVGVIARPNSAVSGVWMMIGTAQWNSSEKFTWHPTGETATQLTVIFSPNAATWTTASPPMMYLNFMYVRADNI